MVCKCDRQKNSLVQEHAKEVTEKMENIAFRKRNGWSEIFCDIRLSLMEFVVKSKMYVIKL
jgi:hypothetical protein